ncbi:MAG: aconitase X swivel domain-containing protein [Candidatus Hodarchaeales archaeon]
MSGKILFETESIGLLSFGEAEVEGEAVVTDTPITLLGFVDHTNGKVVEESHPLNGQSVKDKIFVFPKGVGSTVGPYVLLNLREHNNAPLAILNRESDQGTVSGCSVARIPLAYKVDISKIQSGNWVKVSLKDGKAKITVSEGK